MLAKIICLSLAAVTMGEPFGIERTFGEGVRSLGYNVIYGDEDITMFNDVVDDVEKKALKSKIRLNNAIKPLPAQDVKCLMSADSYCSKDMKEIKSVLIQAIKDDCKECSVTQKESAGKVIATMMAHDPEAWKLFLTRTALQIKPKRKIPDPEPERFREVGKAEEVASTDRFILPGVKVRVKRCVMEKVGV